jgi:hypothetical protein
MLTLLRVHFSFGFFTSASGRILFQGGACGPLAVKAEASDGGAFPRSSSAALRADPLVPRGPSGG